MSSAFKKIIKCSLILFLIISIFMALATIESYTYILGWLAGSVASICGFCLSFFIIYAFNKNTTTKALGFFAGLIKTCVVLVFHALFLWALLATNTYLSSGQIWVLSIATISNPINFFTYLFGISLVPMAIVAWAIISRKEGHRAKICHSI